MRIEASKSSFTLCSRKVYVHPYCMFYCSKAGSPDKSTNKCSFSFTTAPKFMFGKKHIVIKIDNTLNLNLQLLNHTHEPQEYVHRFLPDETLSY